MKNLLVICGPTATGKTALAIKLARKFKGELISADSRQAYQGMDIGTGKDQPKEVVIYLIDVVKPNEQFTVADYVKLATKTIKDIQARDRLPILVGGTGFYIKALIDGIETIGIRPDWELREKLSNYPIIQLSNLLKKIAPEKLKRMNESDRKNPRRLIRAIEIATQIKNLKLKMKNLNSKFKIDKLLIIGLKAPSKILFQRIDQRVEKRVKKGVIEEIQGLLKKGYSFNDSVLGETIGYREFRPYFEGKMDLEAVVQRWKYNEHDYARRQMTWFKKDKRIKWFTTTKADWEKEVVKLIKKWYSKK